MESCRSRARCVTETSNRHRELRSSAAGDVRAHSSTSPTHGHAGQAHAHGQPRHQPSEPRTTAASTDEHETPLSLLLSAHHVLDADRH
jgi:hypothetical protein